jgi:hypothetical protein
MQYFINTSIASTVIVLNFGEEGRPDNPEKNLPIARQVNDSRIRGHHAEATSTKHFKYSQKVRTFYTKDKKYIPQFSL